MKTRFWLCCSLLFGVMAQAKAAKVPEFSADVFAYTEPWLPLSTLAREAAQNGSKRPQRFNITWGIAGPHAGDGGTAIYDKSRHVLWVEYSFYWWAGADNDAESPRSQHTSIQRWRFSHVTPARMQRLIAKYRGKAPDADREAAYFPRLVEVGCRRRLLLNRQTSWREKWTDDGKGGFWTKIR